MFLFPLRKICTIGDLCLNLKKYLIAWYCILTGIGCRPNSERIDMCVFQETVSSCFKTVIWNFSNIAFSS